MTTQRQKTTPSSSTSTPTQPQLNRQDRVGLWVIIFILLILYQIIATIKVLQLQDTLHIRTSIPALFALGMSIIWVISFSGVTLALLRHKRGASRFAMGVAVGFIVYNTLRLALFAQADYDRERLPFLLLIAAILLVGPLLSLLRDIWRIIYKGRGF